MKAISILALVAAPILQLAIAEPIYNRHAHENKNVKRRHNRFHQGRDVESSTLSPEIVILVNTEGHAVSTLTSYVNPAAATVTPTESASFTKSLPAASGTTSAIPTGSTSNSTSDEGDGFGFAYSPYMADGSCKSQEDVNTDFDCLASGYSLVRIYGTDCNQVSTVLAAAKAHDLKLFAGVYTLSGLASEIATIVSAANGDWSQFDTISIGNELVNSGTATAAQVVSAIGTARQLLGAASYTGKIVTVDTLVAARANPSLCDNSDYCAVNCHPFFDGGVAASGSGNFLTTQIPTLRSVLANPSQDIVITETGWPWKGTTNGAAVPSVANQEAAISSIKDSFTSNPGGVILFTLYNDLWKTAAASTFYAEQYWGWDGNAPSG